MKSSHHRGMTPVADVTVTILRDGKTKTSPEVGKMPGEG